VLFADLKGSMELLADRDPEEARKLLDPVLEHMMEAVHHYEGTVNQVMGDGIMALFGAPLAHEDHAVRACYAALRMQEAVKWYAEEVRRREGVLPQIRVGLNSGEVVVRSIGSDLHMDYTAVGQTTHLAARMEQMAAAGSILFAAATLRLAEGYVQVKPLGTVAVKGLGGPIEVFELIGAGLARTRLQAAAARGLTRFLGRDVEMEAVRQALAQAHAGHGQVVALVGEPGVGKSRLAWEVTHSHRVHDWLILEAGSVSYGRTSVYLPVIELLKVYFQIGDRDDSRKIREKVTGKLLSLDKTLANTLHPLLALLDVSIDDAGWQALDPPQRRQRTLDAVKRLLLRESQVQPLLLVFEDLHWIDGESRAFLDGLVDSLPTARILLLVNYRPEYDHRWGSRTYYTQLRLDSLPTETAHELLRGLLGEDAGLEPLRARLIERTEGNPLFLEESVRTLVEIRVLAGERGAYRLARPLTDIEIPATVQAILAARIDRLAAEDRRLLQSAAVIGTDVPLPLLVVIAAKSEKELRRSLAHLTSAEFLYEAALFPEPEYTFKHALTQEVAYASLLQERRRELHDRILGAIEQLYADRLAEHVERLAHHALRAERWDRAVVFCRQAGAKAMARFALRDASAHLERALTASTHLSETREVIEQAIDVRLELRNAIYQLGEVERGMTHLRDAKSLAERLGDKARAGMIAHYLATGFWMMGHADQAQESARHALAIAEDTENDALRIIARGLLGRIHHADGDYRRAAAILRDVLAAGVETALGGLNPLVTVSTTYLAWALAELGEFAEARRRTEESLRHAQTLRNPLGLIMAYMGLGMVHVRQGNAPAAVPVLEAGLQTCHTFGLTALTFHGIAASLGAAYALTNRTAEAIPLLRHVAAQATSMKLVSDHLLGAIPLGEVLLATGHIEEAEQLGTHALDLARRHGQRGHEAHALRLLGEIEALGIAAEGEAAKAHYADAINLAERLGLRPLVAHCHLGLGKLYRRTGQRDQAREHLTTATAMYREMDMRFYLEQAEAEARELPGANQR
jgi:predicted ATPase/class 3 adenylate cyclase